LGNDFGDDRSVNGPKADSMTKSNIKISKVNIDRVPLHKRIDKEVYQSDIEKFYCDNFDRNKGGNSGYNMGSKIDTLQEEMSRQKKAFKEHEEFKRQTVAPQLVNKPKTNAQKLGNFIM